MYNIRVLPFSTRVSKCNNFCRLRPPHAQRNTTRLSIIEIKFLKWMKKGSFRKYLRDSIYIPFSTMLILTSIHINLHVGMLLQLNYCTYIHEFYDVTCKVLAKLYAYICLGCEIVRFVVYPFEGYFEQCGYVYFNNASTEHMHACMYVEEVLYDSRKI